VEQFVVGAESYITD